MRSRSNGSIRAMAQIIGWLAGIFCLLGIPADAGAQGIAAFTRSSIDAATFTAGNVSGSIAIDQRGTTTAGSGIATGSYGGGTNFPGSWYSQTLTAANFLPMEVDNSGGLTYGSYRLTITFDRPILNPVLHVAGLDNAYIDLSATTQATGGAVSLTKLSGNDVLLLTGARINSATALAVNSGCQSNGALPINLAGRCGSVQVNGVYTTLSMIVYDTNLTLVLGDVHGLALSIPNQYDFGDAPASYGVAQHGLGSNGTNPHMGALLDFELANQPSAGATADSNTELADEDGVTLPQFFIGQSGTISVAVSGSGLLQAWIDWNADGDFADAGEQIATNIADNGAGDSNPATGIIGITLTPAAGAATTPTLARFRFASSSGLNATAAASDGEDEDYALTLINASLSIIKSSSVLSNPSEASNPKAIPGAILQYCLTILNDGSAPSTGVSITDVLPAQLGFIPGSMRSGNTCSTATTVEDDNATGTDDSDPVGMSFAGGTVTATYTTLAAGSSFAVTFQASLN